MNKLEKVIKGLECCTTAGFGCIENKECPYSAQRYGSHCVDSMLRDAIALLKSLSAFKEYFDGLYGQGLDVANYHLNGATEPFDNFYDSAMKEYENARCD